MVSQVASLRNDYWRWRVDMLKRLAPILLWLLSTQTASASGATPYQFYCSADADVVGHVVSAKSLDCQIEGPGCRPETHILSIDLVVDDVIYSQPGAIALGRGDAISAAISVRNDPPKFIAGRLMRFSTEDIGTLDFPLTGKPITDALANAELAGHQFLFSIVRQQLGAYARVWRMDQEKHLRHIWSSACVRGQFEGFR